MFIVSLRIREFGGLKDRYFEFSKGLNLISGDNESGKSTLVAFIRFMLYGLPKRRAGEALSDGERAFSWENGVADGSMLVEKDGKRYRIERREQSAGGRKLLTVYDEESGDPLPKGDAPGVLLLGIPAEVFDSTACLRQLRSREPDAGGLSAAIENLLLSGDEAINTERALKNLDKARTTLLHKNGHGGEIHRAAEELAALRLQHDRLREDRRTLRAYETRCDTLRKQADEAARACAEAEEDCAALAETAILTRFDALHEEERRLAARERELSEYEAAHPSSGAELPALCRRLERAAEELDADERNILRCEAEVKIASETPTASPETLRTAEAIRASGGAEAAVRRLTALLRKRRQATVLAVLFFSCSAACLLLGAALALVLAKPIVLLVSLGGVVGFLGLPLLKRAKEIEREITESDQILGIVSSREPTAALERILREAEQHETREERLATAKQSLVDASERAEEHKTAVKHALSEAGRAVPEIGITPRSLRALSSDLARESAEKSKLESVVALLSEGIRRTRETLLPYSEPILRARLPAGFDYRDPAALRAMEERRDLLRREAHARTEERHEIEQRIAALRASVGDSDALLAQINERNAEKAELERKHRAILLAIDAITVARDGLKGQIGPQLRRDASGYLATLSNGKYDRLRLDESLAIVAEENGRSHPSDAFSGGTQDAMYLSLRLALTDLLGRNGEPFPLLLDEALAQLDDTRAEALLRLLLVRAENGGQVLLFTCHTREEQLLANENVHVLGLR